MTDLIRELGKVSELWITEGHPLREETLQALQVSTTLSRRQIEMALRNCFEELSEAKLTAFNASFAQAKKSPINVLHVLPANAFTAWIHGAVISLLLGHRCLLKPSSHEPVFPRAWRKSLETLAPSLAQQVEIVAWEEKVLSGLGAVVAYGSNETLYTLRAQLPPGMPFAGYGHKLSVGIIFRESLEVNAMGELLENVKEDAGPFRLQGCLSPQILYVEDPLFKRWPELESVLDVSPKIKSFTQTVDLLRDLRKFSPFLSCIGYAGPGHYQDLLKAELADAGVTRVCALGQMQRPPLTWRNGGVDLVDLLH